jgi:succinate dehydrogenase/fumarate reductase flavoprotein subunit
MAGDKDGSAGSTMCDVVIAGAGFGGLVAAATASARGLKVVLLEAADRIGGTLALSSGLMHMYDPPSWEAYRKALPTVDEELGRALYDRYPEFVRWLGTTAEVPLATCPLPADLYGDPNRVPQGYLLGVSPKLYDFRNTLAKMSAVGYRVLGDAYLRMLDRTLLRKIRLDTVDRVWRVAESNGTQLFTGTRLTEIAGKKGDFEVRATSSSGPTTFKAASVVLATGGFQGSTELLKESLGPGGARALCRASVTNVGDGLRIGKALGADVRGPMDRFYGYPMPELATPIDHTKDPLALLTCSAFYASNSVLVARDGKRFVDEPAAGKIAAIASTIGKKADGVCWAIFDEDIRQKFAIRGFAGGLMPSVDLVEAARKRGAALAVADTIGALAEKVASEHGVDGKQLARTLEEFNEAAKGGTAGNLTPKRSGKAEALAKPPFYAMKLVPGVSMTYGGLRINAKAELLDKSGAPLPGLYAIPGAAGGLYTEQYGGALASLGSFGRIVGDNVEGRA